LFFDCFICLLVLLVFFFNSLSFLPPISVVITVLKNPMSKFLLDGLYIYREK
jgi:hypothetical protein